jgi:glutamate synthase domain-containing protein 2
MTKDEFLRRYHEYVEQSETEAKAEADRVNTEGIDGGTAIAVHFDYIGWAIMLKSAVDMLSALGVMERP